MGSLDFNHEITRTENFLRVISWFQLFSKRACRQIKTQSTLPLLCICLGFAVTLTSSANGWLTSKRSVVLHASRTLVTLPCPPDFGSISRSCPTRLESGVTLTSETKDFHKQANYTYTVTGGVIVGKGSEVTWDLNGFGPGYYMATVQVADSKKNAAVSSVTPIKKTGAFFTNGCKPRSINAK